MHQAEYQLQDADGNILAADIRLASSFSLRFLGLMGQRSVPGDGLLLIPCKSVHGFFMRMTIAVLFFDREGHLLSAKKLRPWRMAIAPRNTHCVLELPEDRARAFPENLCLVKL